MSYADGLLSTGERISYRNKQHPFVFIWGARYAILALIIAIVALLLGGSLSTDGIGGSARTLLGWVTLILFVGGIAVAVWTALRYINQEYVLTNRRVIQVEGVLNRNSTDSSLEKINDAVLSQSVFGRMFDFGDLTVLTASESRHRQDADAAQADRVQEGDARRQARVRGRHGACRLDTRARRSATQRAPRPQPPRRRLAGPPSGAQGPTAAPAAAPPAQRVDPDEVTRTLANLADLRDRGAITPEEYEAKKADLLSRL